MPSVQRTIAVVMLQPGCNMACAFCVTDSRVSGMSFDQASHLLRRLVRDGFENVVLGGGEPFLWTPGVLRLAAHAKELGLFVQVGTNGIAVPPRFAQSPAVDRWVLPLESADPRAHDALRPWRDGSHHALILDRLEELRRNRTPVTVSTLVTAENIDGLDATAELLRRYRDSGGAVHAWHLYKFIPEGRGGSRNAGRFAVGELEYHAAADAMRAAWPELNILKRPDMFRARQVDFFWAERGIIRSASAARQAISSR